MYVKQAKKVSYDKPYGQWLPKIKAPAYIRGLDKYCVSCRLNKACQPGLPDCKLFRLLGCTLTVNHPFNPKLISKAAKQRAPEHIA